MYLPKHQSTEAAAAFNYKHGHYFILLYMI